MVEVLDHYHGPKSHKLWLIAFAESASDETRVGWLPRYRLAHRAGVSESRASHIAAALVAEGVIKRDIGGYRGAAARYVLAPLRERVRSGSNLSDGERARPDSNLSGERKGAPAGRKVAVSGQKGCAQAATDPSYPSYPSSLSARAGDPRAELARLGATRRETDFIIDKITNDPSIGKPAAYLRTAIGNGDGSELIAQARRGLAAVNAAAPPPDRPGWCRKCDPRTRLIELPDGRVARCPECHPLSGKDGL